MSFANTTDHDLLALGGIIAGKLRIWDAWIESYEKNIITTEQFASDPRAWSLMEVLILWRIHTIGGESGSLKSWVPKADDTSIAPNAIMGAIADMLTACGMWEQQYEYGAEGEAEIFEGWNREELEALATKYNRL